MTKEDCKRLLLEYPDLNKAYEIHVKMDMQEVDGENDNEGSEDMDVDEQAKEQMQRGKSAV